MASPVADSYSVASGATIYAGREPPTPAWRVGVAVNQWVELADTSLSAQPVMAEENGTSTSGKVNAWNGHAADPINSHLLSVAEGGHTDYYGREVERLNLMADVPAWEQVVGPGAPGDVTAASAYYSDGFPASAHGYHTNQYIHSLRSIVRFPGGARATDGNPIQTLAAFNLDTETYGASATWNSLSAPVSIAAANAAYARHPDTDDVYCWFNNLRISRWNPGSPGTFTTLITNPASPAALYTAGAVDPTRGTAGMAFYLGGSSSPNMCRRFDIGAASLSDITLTGADISGRTGMQMHYVEAMDKFVVISGNGGSVEVHLITPTTGTSWACSLVSTTGATLPTGITGSQLPYGKPQYFPALGGIAYHPTFTSNTFFLRLH